MLSSRNHQGLMSVLLNTRSVCARQFENVKVQMRSGGGELHWMGRLSKSRCYMFANPLQQVLAQFSELDSVYIDQPAGPSNTCVWRF